MPRFYFKVFDRRLMIDEEGTELTDVREALVEAVHLAGSLIRDDAESLAAGEDWRMEVTDERGLIIYRLDFSISKTAASGGGGERPHPMRTGPIIS